MPRRLEYLQSVTGAAPLSFLRSRISCGTEELVTHRKESALHTIKGQVTKTCFVADHLEKRNTVPRSSTSWRVQHAMGRCNGHSLRHSFQSLADIDNKGIFHWGCVDPFTDPAIYQLELQGSARLTCSVLEVLVDHPLAGAK